MSKPVTPKQIDPDKAHVEKCPKGKAGYVRHRWEVTEHGGMVGGVIVNKLKCKHCDGVTTQTLDYNALKDIF